MSKKTQTKPTHEEIAEKFCYPKNKKPCIYAENCETNGNWKSCPHAKSAR